MTKDVQAILREIVNDLEKTALGLDYVRGEIHSLKPTSANAERDAMDLLRPKNRKYYEELRQRIAALNLSKD